jgi:hypothetical protein
MPLLLMLLAGCAGTTGSAAAGTPTPTPASSEKPWTVIGFVKVEVEQTTEEVVAQSQRFIETGDNSCVTPTGLDDIGEGAQIQVTAADGDIVAVGQLDAGEWDKSDCAFRFTIPDVPRGEKFYGLHVGNESRGIIQFDEQRLRQGPVLHL